LGNFVGPVRVHTVSSGYRELDSAEFPT
jgi:hypothetical protein